jgi:hypothetical protein
MCFYKFETTKYTKNNNYIRKNKYFYTRSIFSKPITFLINLLTTFIIAAAMQNLNISRQKEFVQKIKNL